MKFVKVREGVAKAIGALQRLDADQIERAGLNAHDVTRAIEIGERYRRIEAMIPAAQKLVEMLDETRAAQGHDLATLLGEIASQARRRGQRDPKGPEILGPLADLFDYQFGPAQKSAATRAKAKRQPSTAPEQSGS